MNPLGILALMGAGASALAPDKAEAAMLPGARKAMVQLMMSKFKKPRPGEKVRLPELKKPSIEIGNWEDSLLKAEIESKFPGVNNRVFTNTHDLGKRFNQRGQSVRETLNQYQAILDAKQGKLVPNFSTEAHASPYGMLVHDGKRYLFSPVSVRHGDFYLDGVMRPDAGQLKTLRGGGWLSSSYPVRAGSIPGASSSQTASGAQLWPISAVTPQENPYLQQQAKPVNHDPYLKDAIERDPLIDPIGAIFWGAGLGGGLAKGAASKILGYAGDLVGGGILDGFLSGDGAPQKGDPIDDTYGDGILLHLGLKN